MDSGTSGAFEVALRADLPRTSTKLSAVELFEVIRRVDDAIHSPRDVPTSRYSFVANEFLSSAHMISDVARFAVLYADAILFRNPFRVYRAMTVVDPRGEHLTIERDPSKWGERERQMMIDDLSTFLRLKPLFDAGVIAFAEPTRHWCPACVAALGADGLPQGLSSKDDQAWAARMVKLRTFVADALEHRANGVLAHSHGDHAHAVTWMPSGLVEYEERQFDISMPPEWLSKTTDPRLLSHAEIRELGIFAAEANRILNDLASQADVSEQTGLQPLSSRQIDSDGFAFLGEERDQFDPQRMAEMGHGLPFVDGLSLEDLLKVRTADRESFALYREGVASVLKKSRTLTRKQLKEAFADEVAPELVKIDSAVANARRQIRKNIAVEVGVTAMSLACIGFAAITPGDVATRIAAAMTVPAAAGAVLSVKSAIQGAVQSLPKEALDNRFLFIWRARKARR